MKSASGSGAGSGSVGVDSKNSGALLHDDLTFHTVDSLPKVCEVTFPDLQDAALAAYYVDLPPLKWVASLFWGSEQAALCSSVSFYVWADIFLFIFIFIYLQGRRL